MSLSPVKDFEVVVEVVVALSYLISYFVAASRAFQLMVALVSPMPEAVTPVTFVSLGSGV